MLQLILVLATASASERAPEVGLTIEPIVAVDTHTENPTADSAESWTWIRARARQQKDESQWFLGVDGEHHIRHGVDTESMWNLYVAESGWSGKLGAAHLRLGALVERWGKLDLTPVIDVLNPRDLRAGPLATIEALRVPVGMANVEFGNSQYRVQATWIPFPSADRVTTEGSDWALIKPGMLNQFIRDASNWPGTSATFLAGPLRQLRGTLNDTAPSTIRALTNSLGSLDQPEDDALHGDYGVRLATEHPGVDAAVVVANLRSSIPQTQLSDAIKELLVTETLPDINETDSLLEDPPIQTRWPRSWMVGAEVSTTAGPFGIRSEAGWWSNKVLQKPWFEAALSPALAAGLGVDWAHGSQVFLAIEGRWHQWTEPASVLYLTAEQRVEVGGTARFALLNNNLELQAATLVDVHYQEWMVRPELRWRISDPVSVGLGAIVIDGPDTAPTTIQETLSWEGGPLGLMTSNDCIFFSMRWIQ